MPIMYYIVHDIICASNNLVQVVITLLGHESHALSHSSTTYSACPACTASLSRTSDSDLLSLASGLKEKSAERTVPNDIAHTFPSTYTSLFSAVYITLRWPYSSPSHIQLTTPTSSVFTVDPGESCSISVLAD